MKLLIISLLFTLNAQAQIKAELEQGLQALTISGSDAQALKSIFTDDGTPDALLHKGAGINAKDFGHIRFLGCDNSSCHLLYKGQSFTQKDVNSVYPAAFNNTLKSLNQNQIYVTSWGRGLEGSYSSYEARILRLMTAKAELVPNLKVTQYTVQDVSNTNLDAIPLYKAELKLNAITLVCTSALVTNQTPTNALSETCYIEATADLE